MRDAVIAPLREIYGVSDKVLAMALQLSAPHRHLAPVRRGPCLWLGLLPARRLR